MSRNKIVTLSSVLKVTKEIQRLITHCRDEEQIYQDLTDMSRYQLQVGMLTEPGMLKELIKTTCEKFEPYKRIQRVLRSLLIMPNNRKDWFLYDESSEYITVMKRETLQLDFADKLDYTGRSKAVDVVYVPKLPRGIFTVGHEEKFNRYQAPFWKLEIRKAAKLENKPVVYPQAELPKIYTKFLTHFTDNDEQSILYILDWLAYSIQEGPKNKTYITAIGAQGVGKGVLGKIIRKLHGDENSSEVLFSTIGSRFNKPFIDKTFIFLDEVIKASADQMNALKRQESDTQEAELKGIDSEEVGNYNNIYIASNNYDSLKLEADDRRHGIINIGTTRLEKAFTQEEIQELLSDNNIRQLGYYLMHYKPNPISFTQGYKSKNALKILNNTTLDWEKFFIDDYCKLHGGRIISLNTIVTVLKRQFSRAHITVQGLKNLVDRYPGIYTIKRTHLFEESGNDPVVLIKTTAAETRRLDCASILPADKQRPYETILGESND